MKGFVLRVNRRRILSSFLFCLCGIVLWSAMLPNGSESIESSVVGEAIRHGDESKPNIAFACNVFWGEEYLPSMLSTFENEGINITFFHWWNMGKG